MSPLRYAAGMMPVDAPKKILLTGASTGIGLAIARQLRAAGHEVWAASRQPPNLPGVHPVKVDLLSTTIGAALRDVPAVDVLINNAGAGLFGASEELPEVDVRAQFQLLFYAPLQLIQWALPAMRAQRTGRIINITSLAAVLPVPFMAPYNAAKAALSASTSSLRLELTGTGIQVIEIQPADINTGFHYSTKKIGTGGQSAWKTQLRNMAAAPGPECVASAVRCAIQAPHPVPVMVVGGFFQARLAPLGARLLPHRLLTALLRRYYRL